MNLKFLSNYAMNYFNFLFIVFYNCFHGYSGFNVSIWLQIWIADKNKILFKFTQRMYGYVSQYSIF